MSGPEPRARQGVRDAGPLILTAELPGDIHRWATGLRRMHYPPARNVLEAHVTLFQALPAQIEDELRALLARIAGETTPLPARLEGVLDLDGGTALRLASPALLDLRAAIAEHFHGMLTAQDSHPPRLHITVQNKVTPAEAKALQAKLVAMIAPRDFAFPSVALHRYRGGYWDTLRRFAFGGARR